MADAVCCVREFVLSLASLLLALANTLIYLLLDSSASIFLPINNTTSQQRLKDSTKFIEERHSTCSTV